MIDVCSSPENRDTTLANPVASSANKTVSLGLTSCFDRLQIQTNATAIRVCTAVHVLTKWIATNVPAYLVSSEIAVKKVTFNKFINFINFSISNSNMYKVLATRKEPRGNKTPQRKICNFSGV